MIIEGMRILYYLGVLALLLAGQILSLNADGFFAVRSEIALNYDPPDSTYTSAPGHSHNHSESPRTTPPVGWAGVGLMAGALAAIWSIRHNSHKHRRHRRPGHPVPVQRNSTTVGPRPHDPSQPPGPHRTRRFDYDRFYLRMTRDL